MMRRDLLPQEELQRLFGPNVLELTERPSHIGMAPYLVTKKGLSPEEHREIAKKFQEWRHQFFLDSIGCKNDKEYHRFVTKGVRSQ
jgi:hypothetical protein